MYLFRYFDVEYGVQIYLDRGARGDRVDTACYSLFRERDIKKNDATCIEFAIKAAERRPSHPCTNLSQVHHIYLCFVWNCPINY